MGGRMDRLKKIEARRGAKKPCPECETRYTVVWEEEHTAQDLAELRAWHKAGMPRDSLPSRYQAKPQEQTLPPCPRCGRKRKLEIIDWDDSPTPYEEARMDVESLITESWKDAEREAEEDLELEGDLLLEPIPDYPPTDFTDTW